MSNIWIGGVAEWSLVPSAQYKTGKKKAKPKNVYELACSTLTDRLTLAATHPRNSPIRPVTNTLTLTDQCWASANLSGEQGWFQTESALEGPRADA